ncbi:TolC family outer membrane protein [Teredinibacter haidensis]|uniref:TolC family outer membrane protein n=1 Tax=Teredinibacter haidensis TaxID=2731755 RepID=UPI0009F9EAC8|nr:TolC family outer membrane protein [Teredinibacter haidensis]
MSVQIMIRLLTAFCCLSLGLFSPYSASEALEKHTLKGAVAQAAISNPGVQAAWNAFEAANQGVRASRGRYLPKLDLTLEHGKERTEDPQQIEESYDTKIYQLVMTQMLFDGFATKQDVAKQNFIKLARYYEFRQVAEETALETAQAYLDVLRYRELVDLSRENYFQHVRYHKDIEDRANSGIGRGVDLEQAKARLALAESNVLTETTNLYDVSARYQRLVGTFPGMLMEQPELPETTIPSQRKDALTRAFNSNPQLNASIENIRAARADLKGKAAPMMPRLDLRLRKQIDENTRGFPGEYDEEAIELVLSYNLYNGGSDKARRKQSRYLMYEAVDTRNRVCREVRQTVAIAHNDIYSKETLIGYLKKNVDAIARARLAYKNQFDIGQRTLLDLLDTENEFFEVNRTLVNERYALVLAKVRTMVGMGTFLYALKVDSLDKEVFDDLDLSQEESLKARCPAESPVMQSIDFDKNKILGDRNFQSIPLAQREVMRLDIKFNHQSAGLGLVNGPEIERAASFLCENPNIRGVVEGHTNSLGSDDYNLELSQARANSVRAALIQQCSSAKGRLSAVGFGEIRPIARNDSELGRATNRRVELVLESGKGSYTIQDGHSEPNSSKN